MAKLLERIQLPFALAVLLVGWLSPIYAAKLWGAELNEFLKTSPCVAATVSQSSWVLLLALPLAGSIAPRRCAARRDEPPLTGEATTRSCTKTYVRMLMLCILPLSLLVICVHSAWYASFSGTNAATNTILWNTDIVTTPLIAMMLTGQRVTRAVAVGGILGLVGTAFTLNGGIEGDTLLGCGLCFAASSSYAVNAVIVENVVDRKRTPVIHLLGYEGLAALMVLAIGVSVLLLHEPETLTTHVASLPSVGWLAFLCVMSLCLNLGWLWCTEIAGAFWTAMVACLTMPFTMMMDILLFSKVPSPSTIGGATLILIGFTVASISMDPDEQLKQLGDVKLPNQRPWSAQQKEPLLPVCQPRAAAAAATAAASALVTVTA